MESKSSTKLAVVIFSDIVDFTKITSKSQSTAMQYIKDHDRDVNELVSKYDGVLLKNLGIINER